MNTPADSAVEVLRSLEFVQMMPSEHRFMPLCPCCGLGKNPGRHAPDCRLHKALTTPAAAGQADEVAELRATIETLRKNRDAIAHGEKVALELYGAALARATTAEAALAASQAEVEKLREALRPFAEWKASLLNVSSASILYWDANSYLTVGDFRRARAALQGDGGREHG